MLRERTGPQITGQAALACLRWPARVLGLLDGQEGSWWQVSYQARGDRHSAKRFAQFRQTVSSDGNEAAPTVGKSN